MRHRFRYLLPSAPAPGDAVRLGDDDAHHLLRVVRRGVGDEVEVMDGRGGLWAAEVVGLEPVTLRVGEARTISAPLDLRLYSGTMAWGRMDTVVEKATELGAREVVIFASSRSGRVPREAEWERRRERLERVVASAARQSGQPVLTGVRGVVPFEAVLAEIPAGEGVLLDPDADAPLGRVLADRRAARLVVGPETGLDASERTAAVEAGMTRGSLGASILRAETACIAGLGVALDALISSEASR